MRIKKLSTTLLLTIFLTGLGLTTKAAMWDITLDSGELCTWNHSVKTCFPVEGNVLVFGLKDDKLVLSRVQNDNQRDQLKTKIYALGAQQKIHVTNFPTTDVSMIGKKLRINDTDNPGIHEIDLEKIRSVAVTSDINGNLYWATRCADQGQDLDMRELYTAYPTTNDVYFLDDFSVNQQREGIYVAQPGGITTILVIDLKFHQPPSGFLGQSLVEAQSPPGSSFTVNHLDNLNLVTICDNIPIMDSSIPLACDGVLAAVINKGMGSEDTKCSVQTGETDCVVRMRRSGSIIKLQSIFGCSVRLSGRSK